MLNCHINFHFCSLSVLDNFVNINFVMCSKVQNCNEDMAIKTCLKFYPGLHMNYHIDFFVFGNKGKQKREENKQTRYSLILCQDHISVLSCFSNVYTKKKCFQIFCVCGYFEHTFLCVRILICQNYITYKMKFEA